ncbi:MAG TPA: transcriptional regulator [Opitutaceae bacterium]|jgi:DNA-binding MarR family transcriptional regulator|nr:transcriptional regulator [Opitutaceae bacterium]
MDQLDPIIHQPARLQIMSALCQLGGNERVDFSYMKDLIGLTDGNLGAHLATLESKAYVCLTKEFVVRKPKTFISVTPAGRAAFMSHVAALRAILQQK